MAKLPGDQPPWLRWSGVGMEYGAAVIGMGLLGYWIDRKYGSSPWGVLVGAGLGLTGATYNLIREANIAFGPDKKKEKKDRES